MVEHNKHWPDVLIDRRVLLGTIAATTAGVAVGGLGGGRRSQAAAAAAAASARSGTPILDGAELVDPVWQGIPVAFRRFVYQTARLLDVTRSGAVMPLRAVTPPSIVLLDRAGPGSTPTAAYFVDHPESIPGAVAVTSPPDWALRSLQMTTDAPTLERIGAVVNDTPVPYGELDLGSTSCWWNVVDATDPGGLRSDDWVGIAVSWHEYFHGIQPWAPEPAPGWTSWDYSFRYPAAEIRLPALGWLEQLVLAEDREPREVLRTFSAIRSERHRMFPELITTLSCRETTEGAANYVEGLVLAEIGAIAHDGDGAARSYPPLIQTDDQWWLNWFAGSIQYAGSSVFCALDRAVGDAWKRVFCAPVPGTPGLSSVDLVRRFVAEPGPGEAAELIRAASDRHDLGEIERRITAADLPSQNLAGPSSRRG